MREQLCEALAARSVRSDMIFLTGDLGFMALEPLREALGARFVNAGVAEQNMMTVAAAMAHQGLDVWVYSIAPFCYARPFEQIRNDISFHNLSVKLIGNGGGYGYGVMGPTHHAIEDYGVLLTLPNMTVYAPVFDEDVEAVVERAGAMHKPAYLRIGRGEAPPGYAVPAYAPWRQFTSGDGPVVVAVGALAGTYIGSFAQLPEARRPNLWGLAEMPIEQCPLPSPLQAQIDATNHLWVAEEHVQTGSVGAALLMHLASHGHSIPTFRHFCARAHHFERYGSQGFLRRQSGLDPAALLTALEDT